MAKNFLLVNREDRVKREVENIYDSYSNPWDVLAELAQNSVDAIRQWDQQFGKDKEHEITIKIERESRSISFEDTGVGISPNRLPDLLAPNATNKAGDIATVGEKGVGLTFCIFSSNSFSIETKSIEGYYSAELNQARTWREKESITTIPDIENESSNTNEIDPLETGTSISLDDVQLGENNEENIFSFSRERLEYLLRTKTAIGNLKHIFGHDEPEITVNLITVDEHGDESIDEISFEYYFPHEFWNDEDLVDLEEFENRDDIGRLSDEQKRQALDGKVWQLQGTITRNGREIRYYGIFLPSRKGWRKVSRQNDLLDEEESPDIQPGIYISTRGMPTGITIDTPGTGRSGYWPNMYLILGYDGFKFDLGRKSIPGRTKGMLREISKEKFNKFVNWRNTIRGTSKNPTTKPTQVTRTQREDRFDQLNRLTDLKYPNVNFAKTPDRQEAGVVAIFHELIGSGELDNYKGYRTGYSQDYDFWGKYEAAISELGEDIQSEFEGRDKIKQNVVLEAKYDAADVIRDIEEERKYLSDIDMIVCWEINEEKFNESSVTVEHLNDKERFYVGSTHKVVPPSANSPVGTMLYVMSLKKYISENRI